MAKRTASKQLTQDNWNEEDDEKEAPGVYRSVDSSILQNRVIRKAKRALPQTEKTMASHSPFSQFTGFGSKSANSLGFSFLSNNCEKNSFQITNSEKHEAKQNGPKSLKAGLKSNVSTSSENSNELSFSSKDSSSLLGWERCESRDVEYYRQLKALNESLFQWIGKHTSKNPWCDFTPVFDDYRKHLKVIEKKYPLKERPSLSPCRPKPFSFKVPSAPVQKSSNATHEEKLNSGEPAQKISRLETSDSQSADVTESSEMLYGAGFKSSTTNTSTFSFGIKPTTTATVQSSNSGPTSSCSSSGKDKTENEEAPSFSLSEAKLVEQPSDMVKLPGKSYIKPFTFAVSPLATSKDSESQPNNGSNEDDEYVPPKNEVVIIKEDNAVYSKKCKLFYKKDDTYREKGVGMLYLLKPNETKTELLIRADTVTGKILLNINLIASLPMQRMGKNNVLVVCIPNPPLSPSSDSKETVSFLIRVKSSEDADELFDLLNKYKS